MAEEKKEEEKDAKAPEETKAKDVPAAPIAPAPSEKREPEVPAPQGPAKEEKKETAPVKKERPSNCTACNKSIKKKRWYYRNGKYYCSLRCWKVANKKASRPEEAQAPK